MPQSEAPHAVEGAPSGLIVGVGASAGGIEPFSELLENLPADTGMKVVLVQHLDPRHESILADLMARHSRMPVTQVQADTPIEPNHVYVIPPDATMVLADGKLCLSRPAPEPIGERRPIDDFLISLADSMHNRAVGVVLSGAASDGTAGLRAIKAEGGITFAQDESARFQGMPRSAIAAGVVDFTLPPKLIAERLAEIARHPVAAAPERAVGDLSTLSKILALLTREVGVSFSGYKQPDLRRGIGRRMVIRGAKTIGDYLALLERDHGEIRELSEDLLVRTTAFFTDPAAFEALKDRALPHITAGRRAGEPIRVWVPGCSTGEEIYSIVISVFEYLESVGSSRPVQAFGTDASDRAVERARGAFYDRAAVSAVSSGRLRRFFSQSDSGYRISRDVRQACVFSRHDITTDPPLAQMDIVSCRNLLMHLVPSVQASVIETLAYALRPGAFFLPGTFDKSRRFFELFDAFDERHGIYARTGVPPDRSQLAVAMLRQAAAWPVLPPEPAPALEPARPGKPDERVSPGWHKPSGVLVDKGLHIVSSWGDLSAYWSDGAPETGAGLLSAVRKGLGARLRSALVQARRRKTVVVVDELYVEQVKGGLVVRITVIPVSLPSQDTYFAILFEELAESGLRAPERFGASTGARRGRSAADVREIEELQIEVALGRERLDTVVQELRATNEEVQSANEELQSSNEELQTAQEELESSNEELNTINAELRERNEQLGRLNDDLLNLLSSTNAPVIMVDQDMRIRRYTPAAERVFRLIPGDIGRSIADLKPRIRVPDLYGLIAGVIETLEAHEQEVEDIDGRGYYLAIRPYVTSGGRVQGATLVLTDITELRRGVEETRKARDYAAAIVDTVRDPLLVLDGAFGVRTANPSFYQYFGVSPDEVQGRSVFEILRGRFDFERVRNLLEQAQRGKPAPGGDVEIEVQTDRVESRTLVLDARALPGAEGESILLALKDITELKRAAEARYRRLFESARDAIVLADAASGEVLDVNPGMEQLFGCSRSELLGRPVWEAAPARDTVGLRAALEQIRDEGAGRFPEMEFKTAQGRSIQAEVIGAAYTEGSRRAIQLNIRDLTERRRFERELRHTQKLESLGLLAGGVAHDFNNLLTGVLGNASLAYSEMDEEDPARPLLRAIMRSAERAADLTRQLLAYAGKGQMIIETIDLSSLVREILALLHSSVPRRVELRPDLAEGLPPVEADPAQIQQVIMNLVINGAEAIGEGKPGVVEIRTARQEVSEEEARGSYALEELAPGTYVLLEVKDNGSGMDEATKARIFDPFFTTKFTGRGLGLAAVSGIVKMLHGAIRVYSAPEEGTTFHVLLPAAKPEQQAPPARTARKAAIQPGTVLVIDDEDVVREAAGAMLESWRFRVLKARSGEEGIEVFRQHERIVSLVLLDLSMPGMGGNEVFDRLREIRPDVPIVLISGYEKTHAALTTSGRSFAGFIQKPFDMKQLFEAVTEALAQEPNVT